jgi:uncharacterized protein YndB with AHSA1/START domain
MSEPGLRIKRTFDAPRELVWKEFTEPERFADWFGGPETEVPLSSVSMDVRPGGAWRATMLAGNPRRAIQWTGEYREVVAPERLVLTMCDRPGSSALELVTVVLTDLGDGRTEMLLQQEGQMRPEDYERTKKGWGGFLDRIAERLSG